jgi:hypothetical protein
MKFATLALIGAVSAFSEEDLEELVKVHYKKSTVDKEMGLFMDIMKEGHMAEQDMEKEWPTM